MSLLKKLFTFLLNLGNKGTTLTALNTMTYSGEELDYAIPTWWAERLRDDAIRRAFWGARFEGKEGSRKPIIVNEDLTKKPGERINFQVVSQIFTPGVTGETS